MSIMWYRRSIRWIHQSRKKDGVDKLILHNIEGQHDLTELNKRAEACLDALKNVRFENWR